MSAETARLSSQHNKLGKPGGPGLFHDKTSQLPAYIQNVAKALERSGKTESEAIQIAIGTVKRWAAGGGKVSPEVRAAAAKAVAEWEALKAKARAKPNRSDMAAESDAVELAVPVNLRAKARQDAAKSGAAMPDGSFPIRNKGELLKAVMALGRAPEEKRAAVKAHIRKRAKALGVKAPAGAALAGENGGVLLAVSSADVGEQTGMVALEVPAGAIPAMKDGTAPDDLHVTLAFLGDDVSDAQFAQAIAQAYGASRNFGLIQAKIGGLGVFPPSQPGGKMAVYVPVNSAGVMQLQRGMASLDSSGNAFTPHITRGFVGSNADIPAPVDPGTVTFSQLIVKRGDQAFRFPLGTGDDAASEAAWANARAAAIELATPAKKQKKQGAPAKGDEQSAKFGEPSLPKGATGWKHGWIPVDSSGKPVGPAEKPKWLQDDEKKQLAAGGKTAQGYRDEAAAKEAKGKADSAKAKAKHVAAVAARAKKKVADALKSKKSKEAAAAKKAASARQKLVTEAYRQAVADQKAGRKLTPQQQRVIGAYQAAAAKKAAALRSVDVAGAKAGKLPAAAPKAATKPLTTKQKLAAAAKAERAQIAADRKRTAGSKAKIRELTNDRVNVLDFAGRRMPGGQLAFRYKHGWILINPAIPSRGKLGGGLAKQHGHVSGTVTHGHFEDHPTIKGKKVFVADRKGGKLASQKVAEARLKKHAAPHTKDAYTTAAQGTPKPHDSPLTPSTTTPEQAHAKTVAANAASHAAQKENTPHAAQVAAKKHADAYVAQKKVGNTKVAEGHQKNAKAWQAKANQLKKAEADSAKLKAQHEAKKQADAEAAAKKKADEDAAKAKAVAEATAKIHKYQSAHNDAEDATKKAEYAVKPTSGAHAEAAKAHLTAAKAAEDAGLSTAAEKHYDKAEAHTNKSDEIAEKQDEFLETSQLADQQSAAVSAIAGTPKLHQKIAAKHEKAAQLAKELGSPALAKHHKEKAEEHKQIADHQLNPPEPLTPAAPAKGGMSAYDAVGEVLFDGLPEQGAQADWEDYLLAAQNVKAHPGDKAAVAKLVAAKKKLTDAGVTTPQLQSANAQVASHMAPPKGAKKVAAKKTVGKKTASPSGFTTSATPPSPTDPNGKASPWDVKLTGPGMYKDGNTIKDLMAKPATSPAEEDFKRDAVENALAAFKKKHGKAFDINSVETFGDLGGGSSTPHLDTSYFDDAEAAGYHHPDPGEDVTHGWKPPAKTKAALLGYTGEGGTSYVPINGHLRQDPKHPEYHKSSANVTAAVKSMDAAFDAAPGLSEDTVTIRKMKNNGQFPGFPPPMSEGDEYTDYGYGSTSKSLTGWSGPVVMQVRMPKGLPVIDVNHNGVVSCSTSEQEVLLPRGARYRVVSDKMVGGQRQIITEVVGYGDTHPNVKGV